MAANSDSQYAVFSAELEELKIEYAYNSTYRTILANRNYLVKETLGTGSYSRVKLAYNLSYPNKIIPVAVKIIERARAPADFQIKFLPREIDIWPRIQHPNILQNLEVFADSKRAYMVLEYAEEGDLLRYVQKVGFIKEERALHWFQQITDAIQYLHMNSIAHRDLKLENLMLDKHFNIKLGDFGFVKEDNMRSLSRTFCGSKSYAAPEIIKGQPYDPLKADIWALGVVLYIMVTGQMPFDETIGIKKILKEQQDLNFQWQQVSNPCRSMILSMFVFDFQNRPDIQDVILHPCMRRNYEKKSPEGGDTGAHKFHSGHKI